MSEQVPDIDALIRRDFVAGAIRQSNVIWEFAVTLTLLRDTHLGAAAPDPRHAAGGDVDRMVDRDEQGRPRLRATTLAGLLRHHLAERRGGTVDGAEPEEVAALFGTVHARSSADDPERAPEMSALDLDDAVGEPPEMPATEDRPAKPLLSAVRTGNRVDPDSGAVKSGLLWQMEVLPAGTAFTATLRLHIRPGHKHPEAELLGLLCDAAAGLERGSGPGIRVGARTGRGLGVVRADAWTARRHDLRTEEGWAGYFGLTWAERRRRAALPVDAVPPPEEGSGLRTAVAAELQRRAPDVSLPEVEKDRRRRDELCLTLSVAEADTADLLAGTAAEERLRPAMILLGDVPPEELLGDVDRAHRSRMLPDGSGGWSREAMLGDTAVFSLCKRIARRLLRELSQPEGGCGPGTAKARTVYTHWWGSDPSDPRDPDDPVEADTSPSPARVALREAPVIRGGEWLRATRTTIDSLFGDTVDGRLFTHQAYAEGSSTLVLDIREPTCAIRGLLALIVRELATVAFDGIGSGASLGHGRVVATSAVLVRHEEGGRHETDVLAGLRDAGSPERAELTEWLQKLRDEVREESAMAAEGAQR